LDETTFSTLLQGNGYTTGIFGKWHSGKAGPWMPWNRGFDESWFPHLYRHENNDDVYHNGKTVKWQGWTQDILVDKSVKFMKDAKSKGKPFFCYLPFLAIHAPWYTPEKYIEKYQNKGLSEALSTLYGMIDHTDYNIGRILKALKDNDLDDDTVVIFTSDNGPVHNPERNFGNLSKEDQELRNAAGLRGSKGTVWENGIRVPFFVKYGNKYKPMIVDKIAHLVDMFPTFLDLSGTDLPKDNLPLDGISIKKLFEGKTENWPDRIIYNPKDEVYWPGRTGRNDVLEDKSILKFEDQVLTVRSQQHKLVKYYDGYHLFDIPKDPQEKHNIIAQKTKVAAKLKAEMKRIWEEIYASEKSFGKPRFLIGDERNLDGYIFACAITSLKGNVKGHGHWTENWCCSGDSQTLNVEVVKSGKYEVKLDASQINNPNAQIEITIGKSKLKNRISNRNNFGKMDLKPGKYNLKIELVNTEKGNEPAIGKLNGLWIESH